MGKGAGLELARFGALYAVYAATRWLSAGRLPDARANAHWIVQLERSLHVSSDGTVRWGAVDWLPANVYLAAQLVVLPLTLVWLYRRAPVVYRQLRNTVIGAWLIAVPVFAIFPVAPPRLVGMGLGDTVSQHAAVTLTGHSTIFYNPYAAVPSLHVGLAFAIGLSLATTFRQPWARALALSWGPLVTLSVIVTGNHYVFDVAAGLIATGMAFSAGPLISRHPRRRPQIDSPRRRLHQRVAGPRAVPLHLRARVVSDDSLAQTW